MSNQRRFRELDMSMHPKCIIISNIECRDACLSVPYKELLNGHEIVSDNGGLMLVRLLISLVAGEIWIAGMDGYSELSGRNYSRENMEIYLQEEMVRARNQRMHDVLLEYMKEVPIKFVTETVLI